MRTALRRDLTAALKTRDRDAINALRSALAAIDNAEAPDADDRLHGATGHRHVVGPGATEVDRRQLTEIEVRAVIEGEVDERMDAAAAYESSGHVQRAERLRSEAALLRDYLQPDR